jgi:hypothetical protein
MATRLLLFCLSVSFLGMLAACANAPEVREPPQAAAQGPREPARDSAAAGRSEPQAEREEAPEPPRRAREITAAAVELSPAGTVAIRDKNSYLAAVFDVDDDGRRDVCLLTFKAADREEPTSLSELSDSARLSEEDPMVPEFFFELYLGRPDGLEPFDTRRIGRFPVLEGLDSINLHESRPHPVAVRAFFQDQIGRKEVWLVVGMEAVSTFMLEHTPVIRSQVVDIDRDGLLDVLKAQSAFEQGRGYETFLTWFRWNGRSFRPHATTNIVRNLNRFLRILEQHLTAGRLKQFLLQALPESATDGVAQDIEQNVLERDVGRLLEPQDAESPPLAEVLSTAEIASVSFPELLENPFPDPGRETSFTAPVRIDTQRGDTFFYSAEIVMTRNPFGDRQFRLRAK